MTTGSLKQKAHFLVLASLVILVACSPEGASPAPTGPLPDAGRSSTPIPTTTPTGVPDTSSIRPADEELDLREANVLAVAMQPLGEGRYRFDVTLLHDDDGEAPSYADKWQVWDTQGNLLGERVLTHSHGTQPFTRSATIEIPEGITTVLVRGHDMQHGHGGQSMRVQLDSGEMKAYAEQE